MDDPIAPAPRWARQPVLWRGVPGLLALCEVGGTAITVDGPGADVWELLECPQTTESLVAALSQRFSATPETVRTDVTALLEHLHQLGFVSRGETTAASLTQNGRR